MPDANAYAMAVHTCVRMLSASRFRSFTGPVLYIRAVERIIYDPTTEYALDCCDDVCANLTRILDIDAAESASGELARISHFSPLAFHLSSCIFNFEVNGF